MKPVTALGIVALAGGAGALVATNPSPDAYEAYATARATVFVEQEVCSGIPENIQAIFGGGCAELVQNAQPQIQGLIREQTERLNLGLLSIYRTDFQVPELAMLPAYEVETVGIGGHFFTYRATEL
ncbi:MAG: DUF4359 domain-containing protein [Leptolyngbyaceae cyanobacterium T60_A2020_046]|nr:DUF4359 domain-containing protein [Leptolyngbyaceae cyanobacterium T60_A2020_046]